MCEWDLTLKIRNDQSRIDDRLLTAQWQTVNFTIAPLCVHFSSVGRVLEYTFVCVCIFKQTMSGNVLTAKIGSQSNRIAATNKPDRRRTDDVSK